MVKLLLGQQSGFTKRPKYHGRWDAVMTDYCWTLKREVPAANFVKEFQETQVQAMNEFGTIMMNNLSIFATLLLSQMPLLPPLSIYLFLEQVLSSASGHSRRSLHLEFPTSLVNYVSI